MDESIATKRDSASDLVSWTRQVQTMRVFDQLIYNVDRNLTNMLIDKTGNSGSSIIPAFRLYTSLRNPTKSRAAAGFFMRLKALTKESVSAACKPYLKDTEIRECLPAGPHRPHPGGKGEAHSGLDPRYLIGPHLR